MLEPPIFVTLIQNECFFVCSVGGYDMVGGRGEELCVWTVTVAGRVMVRQGVTATAPEGTGWMHIPVPAGREVSQISVSPSGKGVLGI